jgi:hypothetical protein
MLASAGLAISQNWQEANIIFCYLDNTMNKLTIKDVRKALQKNLDFIDHTMKSDQKDNPQVVKMTLQAVGRIDALQAVLDAMRGDKSGIGFI